MKRTRIKSVSNTPRARLEREMNVLWSKCIHALGHHKCAICGKTEGVQAAHLISKGSNPYLRFDLWNGLPLCHFHHAAIDGRGKKHDEEMAWVYVKAQFQKHYAYTQRYRHFEGGHRSDDRLREIRDTLKDALAQLGGE